MEPICLQGRTLTGDDLRGLRALIAQHPDWHRTALSRHLCEIWGWRNGVGRRTLTRDISFHGNTQKDWSADYKVLSRSPWEPRALFHPILEQATQEQKLERIVISTDDTRGWFPEPGGRRPGSFTADAIARSATRN